MTVTVERYQAKDRDTVHSLFRRMHGDHGATPFLERWNWQYEQNPNLTDGTPVIWLAKLADQVIGQYATMPVKLMVNGTEVDAAWGMDVMIMPEHQRLGMGRLMFDAWDKGTGAAIGLGLTDASASLFKKLQWFDMGRVPRFVKKLSARIQADPPQPGPLRARFEQAVSNFKTKRRKLAGSVESVSQFDERATQLWNRIGARFAFAVRRDADYLNWKFLRAPHLQYQAAQCIVNGEMRGYVIIRHAEHHGWRATVISDFLCAPDDSETLSALLLWAEQQAIRNKSDVMRMFMTHARFREIALANGYAALDPSIRFVAKINAIAVPPNYYDSFANWHVTVGDSDNDR